VKFRPTLRGNIILSLGLTILIVLAVNTFLQIRNLKIFALDTVGIRSEALAAGLLNNAEALRRYNPTLADDPGALLEKLAFQCEQLYELNRDKNVTHFAVLDPEGSYAAHSTKELTGKKAPAAVLAALKDQKLTTIVSSGIYHTLVPIMDDQKFIGAVDVGIPASYTVSVTRKMVFNSLLLLALFLAVSISASAYFTRITITKPVDGLLVTGRRLAEGRIVEAGSSRSRFQEIAALEEVFSDISRYFQNVAEVAAQVSDGVLDSRIEMRSEHDALGKAVLAMLQYLGQIASVATRIAEGDLTDKIDRRSDQDSFGQAVESMKTGLSSLIVKIRSSSQGIIDSGKDISNLSERGKSIVEEVNAAAEEMMGTMHEMGESIESVAGSMDSLSSSTGETTASMNQMSSSITHISVNVASLLKEADRTMEALDQMIRSIEEAVQNVDESTRLSSEATLAAAEGRKSVEVVMGGMDSLFKSLSTVADAMDNFETRSRDIDRILHVIQEIADNSSLLALNATIIAAQAGVKGKGFGVVAGEMKSLAEGVKNSTQEIAGIIEILHQDISSTVDSIRDGAKMAADNVDKTSKAKEALEKISRNAEQLSEEVTQISNTLHMAGSTSHSVNEAMKKVKSMSDDINSATSQQQVATDEVLTTTRHLDEMSKQIALALEEQAKGVKQVVNSTTGVAKMMENNLSHSESIVQSSERLMAHADDLIDSVRRFQLDGLGGEEAKTIIPHVVSLP